MKNLLALVRPLTFCRPFSAGRLVSEAIQIPKKPLTPLSTRDLVAFKTNIVKPADITPLVEAPELYARIHIHKRNLLVTEGDIIKLPVNMKDVKVGDTLVFDQVSELGSRNHTLSGDRIDPSLFSIKGVVLEKSRVKRTVLKKTRRRRRHVRSVVQNNSLTVIRVSELKANPTA